MAEEGRVNGVDVLRTALALSPSERRMENARGRQRRVATAVEWDRGESKERGADGDSTVLTRLGCQWWLIFHYAQLAR